MDIIRSTYRIQFNDNFNFQQFEQIIGYLHDLGIDTIYASPILRAMPGSQHGYDGTDVQQINPELGTLDQFIAIKEQLNQFHIKWLQDIVPNHMAYHPENAWLADVLEYGKASIYHTYFDTVHSSKFFGGGKLMLPILSQDVSELIDSGELAVVSEDQQLWLRYFDHCLPVSPASYGNILGDLLPSASLGFDDSIRRIETQPGFSSTTEWQQHRSKLFKLLHSAAFRKKLSERLSAINQCKERLSAILDEQHYQLCRWDETDNRINYRRFFTVNGLICMNVQDDRVFEATHRFIAGLLARKIVDGLRIDHIDGLYNPTKYVRDLRKLCGPKTYIVVEKILEQQESLPVDWPIQGTTGYDFLALCNQVCTDVNGKQLLTHFYQKLIENDVPVEKQQIEKKLNILSKHMRGEVDNLFRLFLDLELNEGHAIVDPDDTRGAIELFLAHFPIYRLYEENFPFSDRAYSAVMQVFDTLLYDNNHHLQSIIRLREAFTRAQQESDPTYREKVMLFFRRCMQFTGPVMAKGVEDTLMYTYNRFIAHNEVGDHPGQFGISMTAFHEAMQQRQKYWPSALNTTSTHDTKRGEDVRSRLHIWTAWPEEWIRQVEIWQEIVKHHYTGPLPHPNDIYFIYQALFGSHPMPDTPDDNFLDRFSNYLTKYLREGKERSDWGEPNEAYEQEIHRFARFLVAKNGPFYPFFYSCLTRVVDFGILNSLTQVLLKFTCPGIPDVYQGTELWDLSFVDPDNRRKVSYDTRKKYLAEINELPPDTILTSLWETRYTGKIKLWLIKTLLHLRKQYRALSPDGEYIPLEIKGKYSKNILAYARKYQNEYVITVVALHLPAIDKLRKAPLHQMDWEDTAVVLPTQAPVRWQHLLYDSQGESTVLQIASIFNDLPIALLHYNDPPNHRSAGVLLHITSLPSPSGIGDLGAVAFNFAEFLHSSAQRWWQILPLGPTSRPQYHSPYSTRSAMAGNPLLIDLEALVQEGLLTKAALKKLAHGTRSEVDFERVELVKRQLLHLAFQRVDLSNDPDFEVFCAEEAYWLDDYACFVTLHNTYSDQPWYTWPQPFKSRDPQALTKFIAEQDTQLREEKWIQYIFFKQWKKLKAHCNALRIQLLGDVPMYVGYDSADVWAHPALFSLAEDGSLQAVAGVPPDYFNADGQLWGMPTYTWDAHRQDRFQWWMRRLAHNCTLFDKIRLDHFRAFSAYWEVPATECTAKHGKWISGPGEEFFNEVRSVLGKLPFVVEDLGDIDDAVYALRDAFQLPGTKVLQFAFGDDMPSSPHIPHNYSQNSFAYTGTHDNNTVVGWFEDELDDEGKERLTAYTSVVVDETNISDLMIKTAYASVADTVIVPLQDMLSLPAEHRMNNPAAPTGNWRWIAPPDAFGDGIRKKLRQYIQLYGRAYEQLTKEI